MALAWVGPAVRVSLGLCPGQERTALCPRMPAAPVAAALPWWSRMSPMSHLRVPPKSEGQSVVCHENKAKLHGNFRHVSHFCYVCKGND